MLSPFECLCGNFILPEPASYVFFYAFFNLRNLLYIIHNMTNHLLGGDVDMTRDEYSKMRGSSVREVASTHGNISFKDVLLFHQEE